MFVIVLNSNNIVQDGQNNKLVYKFPNSVLLKDKYVAVSNISMYYSWFNITSAFQNNTFTYTWNGNTLGVAQSYTFTVDIPDGAYDISTLNNLFQYECIKNGTYWTNSTGNNVYPAEFILSPSRYAVQINTYYIKQAVDYPAITTPSNFKGFPITAGTTFNTVITIPANLNIILGYTAGFYTNNNLNNSASITTTPYVSKDTLTGTISYLSTTSPQVQPNNNVLFSLSGINNPYTQPSSIIYSLNPNVSFGSQISVAPPNFMWNKFIDGTYNELRLTLLGTDLKPLIINDPNMTILLTIRDKEEIASK